MKLWRRLLYLLPSRRRVEERDMREELDSLRDMAGPGELGNLTIAAENGRDAWGWTWIDQLMQDFRYGWRTLLKYPGITVVALLSLALGIGANTMVFSFLNVLLFRAFPYPNSEKIILVESIRTDNPGQAAGLSRGDCASLAGSTEIFERFGCYTDRTTASIGEISNSDATIPERVSGQEFTAGAVEVLNIVPVLGRWFTKTDEADESGRVLLISHNLWQKRYGGAMNIIGRQVRFDSEPATVIGVMGEGFESLDPRSDFWVPFRSSTATAQSPARILGGIGRMRTGIELPAAQSAANALAAQVAEQAPQTNKGWAFRLRSLNRLSEATEDGELRSSLLTLPGAVVFVLIIACANVASLLLSLGTTQHKEIAVRVAIGSSRRRIFRQLLAQSVLLAAAGGVLGLGTGLAGIHWFRTILPAGLPPAIYQASLDLNVFAFGAAVSLVCGISAGFVPALQVSYTDPLDAVRESGVHASAGVARQRLRSAFVATQIALALVLLVGAGLMVNSLINASNEPLGFDPDNLVTVAIDLPEGQFRNPVQTPSLSSPGAGMEIQPNVYLATERIRLELAAIPGAQSASAIAIYPPLSGSISMPVLLEDQPSAEAKRAQFLPVMADYFRTLRVAVKGREFNAHDSLGSLPVVVINDSMARQYWPNESPIGKRLRIETPLLPDERAREVIGVVGDIAQYLGQNSRPQLYIPYSQLPPRHDERLSNDLRRLTFIVQTSETPDGMAQAISSAVATAAPGQAVSAVRTMKDTAFASRRREVLAQLLGTFGIIAVILAVIGVYGVMAQAVSQRTNEIGIRMALGADLRKIRALVLHKGMVLVSIGLAAGIAGSLAVTRVLRGSLYGVSATDPLTFLGGLILLGGIALLACYLPARRAARIDPTAALRHE